MDNRESFGVETERSLHWFNSQMCNLIQNVLISWSLLSILTQLGEKIVPCHVSLHMTHMLRSQLACHLPPCTLYVYPRVLPLNPLYHGYITGQVSSQTTLHTRTNNGLLKSIFVLVNWQGTVRFHPPRRLLFKQLLPSRQISTHRTGTIIRHTSVGK